MATIIIFHEVEDGPRWAKAWKKGTGSRHEMFAQFGVIARTFKDPKDPTSTGVMLDVPDMERFERFMASNEAKSAMAEDGLKSETIRMLSEFKP